MHSKVLAVLPMVCDRRWGRCGVSWRWCCQEIDYWFDDANGAEGEERAQPHESEQRDCNERGKNMRLLSLS